MYILYIITYIYIYIQYIYTVNVCYIVKTATFSQYIFFSFFKSYFILLGNGFSERLIGSYF